MLLETKKLAEERAVAFTASRAMLEQAQEKGVDLTPEQDEEYKKYLKEYKSLDKKIKLIEESNKLDSEQAERLSSISEEKGTSEEQEQAREDRYSEAFDSFLRKGINKVSEEDRVVIEDYAAVRAQSVGTDSEGGFTVPQAFSNELEKALLAFGGLRSVARVISRSTGAPLDWPTVDGTSNSGAWLSENTDAAETDEVFDNVTFNAFTSSSDLVKVSRQLMQDSAFPMASFLAEQLGERIGRLQATAWIAGTGSGQPTGVRDSASFFNAADDVTISFTDLIGLKHSLDPAYRERGAVFVLNDSTLEAISKLQDQENRFLWQPSLVSGTPDLIVGHRYVIDQAMADIGTGNRSVLFGDFSKYIIMDVLGIDLMRLDELFAQAFQVAFIAFARTDGKLVDAGTNPVKALRHLNT